MIFNKNHRKEAIEYVDSLFAQDKRVTIVITKEKRTLDQNRLYWLWLTCIAQNTGNNKDSLHEYFVWKFIQPELVLVFEKMIYKRLSTTLLDTKKFTEYLNKIQLFANTELAIELPNPEDKKFEEFKDYYEKYL